MYVKIDDQKLAIGTLSVDKNPPIQFDLVFDKEFELSHTSKTTIVFFIGYKVEQPFKEDGYPFLFSIELVLFQVEVIRTFFVSLTSYLPSSTMDLDSEDEDEELNVPVVKENGIYTLSVACFCWWCFGLFGL
jgi:hypothetical protein